jgi:hypothetical protein
MAEYRAMEKRIQFSIIKPITTETEVVPELDDETG